MTTLLRDTKYGPVSGFLRTTPLQKETRFHGQQGNETPLQTFLGVPYGQAQRFEYIQPPSAWTEPLPCFDYGPMPPQPPSFTNDLYKKAVPGYIDRDHLVQSEVDFATVNVHAPANTKPGDKLPVLVFLYGGALNTGSSGASMYDPCNWLRRSIEAGKPFIFVSGNYRTGIFGFVASKDLQEADPSGLTGNYGARDALAIFEWVAENIGNFGGDPDNITGCGQSAGAFLISQLLFAFRAASRTKRPPPMRKAILQSGASATMQIRKVVDVLPQWDSMLKELGIEESTAKERIEALRLVPTSELLAYASKIFVIGMWALTLEEGANAIWTESTVSMMKRGEWDDRVEAVILGTTADEGSLFSAPYQTIEAYTRLLHGFPEKMRPTIEQYYPIPKADNAQITDLPSSSASLLFKELYFESAAAQFADFTASRVPTYVYRLNAITPAARKGLKLGVMHACDIPYLFNIYTIWEGDDAEADMSRFLGDAWADFATTGHPHASWDPYSASKSQWLMIETGGKLRMQEMPRNERHAMWIKLADASAMALSA